MATEQIAMRLPVEQLAVLDDLVDRGVYGTRAAAVRAGIVAVLELDRRHRDDRSIIDGYGRMQEGCVASFDNLRVVAKAYLVERQCVLDPARLFEACDALRSAVDC